MATGYFCPLYRPLASSCKCQINQRIKSPPWCECTEVEMNCNFYKYRPVMLSPDFLISFGVPQATICPPCSPPPGPMSIT